MRIGLRGDDGQASIEQMGLIAVIALVLVGAGGAVAAASPVVRNRVTSGFQHALCVVTGQECRILAPEACPMLRTVKTTGQGVAISYLRLGHDKILSIERRSDGTYGLSLLEGTASGLGIADQRGGGVLTGDVEAALMLGLRAGRTYEAATPEAARALVERLRDEQLTAVRTLVRGAGDLAGLARTDPSVTSYVLAGDAALEALGKFGLGGIVETGGKYRASRGLGVRIAAHREEITAYATMDARASAFFEVLGEVSLPLRGRRKPAPPASGGVDLRKPPAGGPSQDPRGSGEGKGNTFAVKNPLAQKHEGVGVTGGSLAMTFGPGPELKGIEVVGYAGHGSERRELRARLDPRDPAVRAALEVWRRDPADASKLADLGRAAGSGAAIDERRFKTTYSEHQHGGKAVVRGHALGLTFGSESVVSELVEQRSRPVGGVWEERLDCRAEAQAS